MESSIYQQFYKLEKDHWWFKGIYFICREELKRLVLSHGQSPGPRILDIGCGTGYWAESMLSYGRVFSLDKAEDALNICRGRGLKYLVQGDAETMPISSSSCDIVTGLGLVEHLDNENTFFEEVERVLKPGGRGLLLTSAYMFLWGRHDDLVHHKRRYTKNLVKKAVESAGLEVLKVSYINFFLFLPILLIRAITGRYVKRDPENRASPDLFMPVKPLNYLFYGLLRLESLLLRWLDMPFGVNLVIIFRKKGMAV